MLQLTQKQFLGLSMSSLLSITYFQIAGLGVFFYLAYADTFKELWHYWVEGDNWQFIVPIAFAYMLWERQDLYSGLKREPNIFFGTIFLVLACVLLMAGEISSTHSLRELSIIASIFSLVLLLFGTQYVKSLFWPLMYLVLMISLTSDLLEQLRYPLKLIAAIMAEYMLQYTGYSVYREGTFLQLPYITLEVADECSGLNQLVSAIALGIPIAYTFCNRWGKRVFIILFSCVMGLVMNWIRVYLISLWHYDSAKEVIHGPQGIYELPFIFMGGVFVTFFVAGAIADKKGVNEQNSVPAITQDSKAVRKTKNSYTIAIIVLMMTAFFLNTWKMEPIYLKGNFSDFPLTIAGQQGKPISKLELPFYSDLAHNELILDFSNPLGIKAKVYVGYFHSQDNEKELIDYRYNWLHKGASTMELTPSSSPVQIKTKHVNTGAGEMKVYFWYDVNGRILTNSVKVKLASLIDAVLRNRTNGAIVIVQIEDKKKDSSVDEKEFVKQVMILTEEYLKVN